MGKKIYLIAAVSDNGVIGVENRLPWHYSVDLKKFKQVTTGNTVIMGRRTFEGLHRKPLPDRENFVLTHSKEKEPPKVKFFDSLQKAVNAATKEKIFLIGGQNIYEQALQELPVSGIYLTKIHQTVSGDAYFPKIPISFKEVHCEILKEQPKIEFVYLENEGIASSPPSADPRNDD